MKKHILYAALASMAILSVACSKQEEGGGGDTPTVDPVNITMSQTKASVEEGATITLTVIPTPTDATVGTLTWTSSRESTATVDNGVVTGVAAGSCKITATTSKGLKATCSLTVQAVGGLVTDINFKSTEYTVDMGKTVDLSTEVEVLPTTAKDKDLTWSSNDETVAKVSADGVVTGVMPGKTKIFATNDASGTVGYTTINVSEGGDTGRGVAIDRCNSTTDWYSEMDCDVVLDKSDFKTGIGSLKVTTVDGAKAHHAILFKNFEDPVDAVTTEGVTRDNGIVIITFYVDNTSIFTWNEYGQIEISSGAKQDVYETCWTWGVLNTLAGGVRNGWNTVELPLANSAETGGSTDWSSVNFVRIYHENVVAGHTFKLDQMRVYNKTKNN